jgi:sodium/bile acid cotransporter 3/5
LAEKAKGALRPVIIFIIIFIMTFGVYANLYMFRLMNWRVILSGLLLPWCVCVCVFGISYLIILFLRCGFMFGCLTALILRQPHVNVAAISIETGIQNTGVAIMLLKVCVCVCLHII